MKTAGSPLRSTFDIDPDEMFHAQRLRKLSSVEPGALEMPAKTGVDAVVALPFTREFAASRLRSFWPARSAPAFPLICTWAHLLGESAGAGAERQVRGPMGMACRCTRTT